MLGNIRQRKAAVLTGVVSIVVGVLLISPVVLAVDYRGIGGQPANPRQDNPRSKSIFVYELEPGSVVTDAIKLSNGTNNKERVAVYATDSLRSSGGAFACEQKADTANDVGSWIKLSKEVVELAPQSSTTVDFTLTVPKDANPGESNGCIAIQALGQRPVKDVNGIALNFRSAVRVAVTVPGELKKALSITYLRTQKLNDGSKLGVQLVMKNAGNVSLDTDVKLVLKDLLGRTLETITGTYSVFSGTPTELNFEFKRPYVPGIYSVTASAAYNNNTAFSLGEGDTTKSTIEERQIRFFAWPQTQYTIATILVLLVFAAVLYRYMYQRRLLVKQRANARTYTTKEGDTLEKIAEKFDTSWYDIALLNKIKPPYNVSEGTKLYVPPKAQKKKKKNTNKKHRT